MCVRPDFNGKSAAIGDYIISVNSQVVFRCNIAYINGSNILNWDIKEVWQYGTAPTHEIDYLDPVRAVVPRHVAGRGRRQIGSAVRVEPVEARGNVRIEEEDVAGKGRWRGREGGAGADARGVPGLASDCQEIGMGCNIRTGNRSGYCAGEVVVGARGGILDHMAVVVVRGQNRSFTPIGKALSQPGPLRRCRCGNLRVVVDQRDVGYAAARDDYSGRPGRLLPCPLVLREAVDGFQARLERCHRPP